MRSSFPRRATLAACAGVGLLAIASQAEAHAHLVSATPAENSRGAAPRQVALHFSEALVPRFSSFELMKADGTKVSVTTSVPPGDRKSLVGVLPRPLAPGAYRVTWHVAAADDGHRTKGDFSFTVQ